MNKFKLLILMILPSFAFAEHYFIVENSTMVNAYFNVFNAIGALFQSNDYLDLLRFAFLIGGFFVFAGGVLKAWEGNANANILSPYGKYLAVGVALLTLVFSQKDTLWVTTNNIPSYCSTAPATTGFAVELPSILTYTFAVTNKIGRGLTDLAETAYSIPGGTGSATMTDSGGYLGSLKQTINLLSINPNEVNFKSSIITESSDFMTLWQRFFSVCVFEVANNKGVEGEQKANEILSTKDIYTYIKGGDIDGTTVTSYLDFVYSGESQRVGDYLIDLNGMTTTCDTYFLALDAAVSEFMTNFNCAMPLANGGVLELLTGSPVGTGSDLAGIARQSGLINALATSKSVTSLGISGASYAAGKTLAESNQQNLGGAQYMAQMLPYIQMTMRAILYAFFPFVFVVVLLPGGIKVLTQYMQTMIWIELWGPTAAVVNMFVNLQVQEQVGKEFNSVGLNYISSVNMLSESNTIAGVGAMLYLTIPALTWLILKGSGHMLGNVTGGISAKFAQNLNSDSIKKDMSEERKHNEVNRARLAQGKKALSYGEMMHYESGVQGMQMAATTRAAMDFGGNNLAKSEYQAKGAQAEIAARKSKEAEGDKGVVTQETAQAMENFSENKQRMEQLGVVSNGKIDMGKLNSLAKTNAAAKSIQTLANSESYKNFAKEKGLDANDASTMEAYTKGYGASEGKKDYSNKEVNKTKFDKVDVKDVVTTESAKQVEQVLTDKKTQEKTGVVKDGEINDEGMNNKTDVTSTKNEIDYKSEVKTQNNNSVEELSTSNAYSKTESTKLNNKKIKENGGNISKTSERFAEAKESKEARDMKTVEKAKNKFGGENNYENEGANADSTNDVVKTKSTNKVEGSEGIQNMVDSKVKEDVQKINQNLSEADTAAQTLHKDSKENYNKIKDMYREQIDNDKRFSHLSNEEKDKLATRNTILAFDKRNVSDGNIIKSAAELEIANAAITRNKKVDDLLNEKNANLKFTSKEEEQLKNVSDSFNKIDKGKEILQEKKEEIEERLNDKNLSETDRKQAQNELIANTIAINHLNKSEEKIANENKNLIEKSDKREEALNNLKNSKEYKEIDKEFKASVNETKDFYQNQANVAKFDKDYNVVAAKDDMDRLEKGDIVAASSALGQSKGDNINLVSVDGSKMEVSKDVMDNNAVDEKKRSFKREFQGEVSIGYALNQNGVDGKYIAGAYKVGDIVKNVTAVTAVGRMKSLVSGGGKKPGNVTNITNNVSNVVSKPKNHMDKYPGYKRIQDKKNK